MSPPPAALTASAVNTNSFLLNRAGTSSALSSPPSGAQEMYDQQAMLESRMA